jgi:hypothetical protein
MGALMYISQVFLTLVTEGGEWSSFMLWPLYFPGKSPGIHWKRGWVDSRTSLDAFELQPLRGIKLFGHPAHHDKYIIKIIIYSNWYHFRNTKLLLILRHVGVSRKPIGKHLAAEIRSLNTNHR